MAGHFQRPKPKASARVVAGERIDQVRDAVLRRCIGDDPRLLREVGLILPKITGSISRQYRIAYVNQQVCGVPFDRDDVLFATRVNPLKINGLPYFF